MRSDDSGRRERTRPGFLVCVLCASVVREGGDRGAKEIGQQEEAETASGCPKRWCWSNGRAGGT